MQLSMATTVSPSRGKGPGVVVVVPVPIVTCPFCDPVANLGYAGLQRAAGPEAQPIHDLGEVHSVAVLVEVAASPLDPSAWHRRRDQLGEIAKGSDVVRGT